MKDVKPELLDNPRLFRNKGSKRKKKKAESKVQIPSRREKDFETRAEEEISGRGRCSSSPIRPNLLGKKLNHLVPLPANPARRKNRSKDGGKPLP